MAEKKPLHWLLKIETTQDARKAMRLAYVTFYTLAALEFASFSMMLLLALHSGSDAGASRAFALQSFVAGMGIATDTFLLALLVHARKSRTAASVLLAIELLGSPFRIGLSGVETTVGLVGVFALVGFLILAGIMGLRGTIRYHALLGTRVIWRNLITNLAVTIAYVLGAAVATRLLRLVWVLEYPSVWYAALGMLLVTAAVFGGAFRILPGTRSRPTVTRPPPDDEPVTEDT